MSAQKTLMGDSPSNGLKLFFESFAKYLSFQAKTMKYSYCLLLMLIASGIVTDLHC